MDIQRDISLKAYNTFGIDVNAELFCRFSNIDELKEGFSYERGAQRLILGGGSNMLLTKHYQGMVMRNEIQGMDLIKEDEAHYYVKVGAGVSWHQFVMHCVQQDMAGVENLSLIPGSLGAAPMQNIGAYGVELKEVFNELEAYHIKSGEIHRFGLEDCQFGYRESVFKHSAKGEYVICSVTFKLDKQPTYKTTYGAIEAELERMSIKDLSIKAISDAVIAIRQSKLPDPAVIGNSGSFFKNPVIGLGQFNELRGRFPDVPNYPAGEKHRKVAAGWLIEQAGWKGKNLGNYGVHDKQALVLVNHGGAKGSDIYALSGDIIESIKERFGIDLEREVNVI